MASPIDKVPAAKQRPDVLEQIESLFDATKEMLKGKKSKQEITASDLNTICWTSGISKLINHKGSSHVSTLGVQMEELVQRYGIDSRYYREARKKILPEVQKAGYELSAAEQTDGWSHFSPIVQRNKTKERIQNKSEGVEIAISYKVYITLVTDGADGGKNIDSFLKRLPEIAAALEAIAAKYDTKISFKIPSDLGEMLLMRDTLVIHTNKKDILREIHEKVVEVLTHNDTPIAIERDERGHFGFDFTSVDERYAGSYTELLSRVLAGRVASVAFDNPGLLQKQQAGSFNTGFLKKILKTTSTWSPQRMAAQLQDPLNRSVDS